MRYNEFKITVAEGFEYLDPKMLGGLKKRGSPAEVTELQTWLNANGYDAGTADGIYGMRTVRAVRKFQHDNDLTVDGDAGTQTISKMLELTQTGDAEQVKVKKDFDIDTGTLPEYPEEMSDSQIEAIIRKEAKLRGIDPDVAVAIFRSEGKGSYQSTIKRSGQGSVAGREASYGPFQLYTGGGLGNEYQRKTGRDLTKDNNKEGIVNQIRFALDMAVRDSWQPWYGRKTAGINRRQGLAGAEPAMNWA